MHRSLIAGPITGVEFTAFHYIYEHLTFIDRFQNELLHLNKSSNNNPTPTTTIHIKLTFIIYSWNNKNQIFQHHYFTLDFTQQFTPMEHYTDRIASKLTVKSNLNIAFRTWKFPKIDFEKCASTPNKGLSIAPFQFYYTKQWNTL